MEEYYDVETEQEALIRDFAEKLTDYFSEVLYYPDVLEFVEAYLKEVEALRSSSPCV